MCEIRRMSRSWINRMLSGILAICSHQDQVFFRVVVCVALFLWANFLWHHWCWDANFMMKRNDERFVLFNWIHSIVSLIKLNWMLSWIQSARLLFWCVCMCVCDMPITLKNQRFASSRIHIIFILVDAPDLFSTWAAFRHHFTSTDSLHLIFSVEKSCETIHGCCYTGRTCIFYGYMLVRFALVPFRSARYRNNNSHW